MFWHYGREGRTGIRAWWHFKGAKNRALKVEFYWWSKSCHVSVDVDDDGWTWGFALPPFSLWLSFDGFPSWRPQKKCIATWDGGREFWLTDQRTCALKIHDWSIWLQPWSKTMEWAARDPWWVRGVTIDFKKLLGKWVATTTEIGRQAVVIPMPEGVYHGIATTSRWSRGRRFWFKRQTTEVWLEIPKGIPHAGKGENSWDCGDDGLFGIGGSTVEDAIGRAVASVLKDRRRYGHASPECVRKALA